MSALGLFVPTYGKSEADGRDSAAKQTKASRVLPSKPTVPQPKIRPSSLSSLVFNGNIEYIQTWEAADQAARALEAARPGVLGFDIEWQVSFVKGQAPAPTATLQLCAPEHPEATAPTSVKSSPVWGTAFIFHLFHMRGGRPSSSETPSNGGTTAERVDDKELASGGSRCSPCLPESLVRVLSDPGVLLAGVGVSGDVCRLEKEYEQLRALGVNGVVDLSQMANMKEDPDLRRRGMWSLADLCAQVLGLDLAKPDALRRGSWEKRPLNVDQLFYAAADAYAGLRLWQVMQAMPDLTIQRPCRPSDGEGFQSGGVGQRSVGGDAGGASGADTGAGFYDSLEMGSGHDCHAGGSTRPAAAATDEENKARSGPGSGRPARQVRLPLSKTETHRMWHEHGLSVEAVAEARRNKTSTILGYLADCIEAGLPYDWKRINIASDTEKEIVRALVAVADSKAATSEAAAGTAAVATAAASTPAKHAAAIAAEAAAATTPEGAHAEHALPEGSSSSSSSSTPASTPHDGAQASTTCGCRPTGAIPATADGAGNAILPIVPTETLGKRQRMLAGSCASRGLDCVMTDGMSRQNSSGHSQGEGVGVGADAGKVGETIREGVSVVEPSAAARWESVGLREVKELAPAVEYWQIRMVLARFRSGWCGYARSE